MVDTPNGLPSWITAGIVSIIVSLSGAIVFLYKLMTTQNREEMARVQAVHTEAIDELRHDRDELKGAMDECRSDRENLRVELATLQVEVRSCVIKIQENEDK